MISLLWHPRNESIFLVKKLSFLKMKGPPPPSSWGTCESHDLTADPSCQHLLVFLVFPALWEAFLAGVELCAGSQHVCSDSLGVSALRSSVSLYRQNKTSKTDRGRKWDVSSTGFVWDKQGDITWLTEHKAKKKTGSSFLFIFILQFYWLDCVWRLQPWTHRRGEGVGWRTRTARSLWVVSGHEAPESHQHKERQWTRNRKSVV